MSDSSENPQEITLKISTSVDQKRQKEDEDKPVTKLRDGNALLEQTNTDIVKAKRNTEYGVTDIQIIRFREEGQQKKILRLLDNPTLYKKLPIIFELIYELGCDTQDGELRYYAALAVSELSYEQPFAILKNDIIQQWANHPTPRIQSSAAMALAAIITNDQYKNQVLKLLMHWISLKDNPRLTSAALQTYYHIVENHTSETLEAIKKLLDKGVSSLHDIANQFIVIDIYASTYYLHPEEAINYLYDWLQESDTQAIAGLLFLVAVELKDLSADEISQISSKLAEIVFTLWDDISIPMSQQLHEGTAAKVQCWAIQGIEAHNNNDQERFEAYQQFFTTLDQKYKGQLRDRVQYYFERWQRSRDKEQDRLRRRQEKEQARAARRQQTVQNTDGILQKDTIRFVDLVATDDN